MVFAYFEFFVEIPRKFDIKKYIDAVHISQYLFMITDNKFVITEFNLDTA